MIYFQDIQDIWAHTYAESWRTCVEIFSMDFFFGGLQCKRCDSRQPLTCALARQSLALLLKENTLNWLQLFIKAQASTLLRNSELDSQWWARNLNSSNLLQLCFENFTCENIAVIPVTDWLPATTVQCILAYKAIICRRYVYTSAGTGMGVLAIYV